MNGLVNGNRRDWRLDYFATVGTVFALYVSLKYVTVLIHEVLGHGATTSALGGSFFAVYATPVSGYASLYLPGMEPWMLATVLLGGIAVTGAFGIAALVFSKRTRGFSRVALLLFSETALMTSALYLAYGGLRDDGDPYAAMGYLGLDHNALAPLGVVLAICFGILLSMEFSRVDIFNEPRSFPRTIGMWLPGLVMGIVAISAFALDPGNAYAGLYGATYVGVAIGGSYFAGLPRKSFSPPAAIRMGTRRQAAAVLVCLLVSGYAWAGIFGPSAAEAKGLVIGEPPVEVESSYYDSFVGNVRIVLHPNGSAMVEFGMAPLNTNGTPLDRKIHETFDTRPFLPDWASKGRRYTSEMLNLSANQTSNLTVNAELAGEVEGMNATFPHARTCTMWVELNVTGGYNVSITDPWMKNGGYLDKLTVEWAGGLSLAGFGQTGGAEPTLSGDSLIWNNSEASMAPRMVEVRLNQ